nr:hypothetical protein B0A51_07193 [Rachicladosporium sp. CCFEE 5018]
MEHSAAILEDAGKLIDQTANTANMESNSSSAPNEQNDSRGQKRKGDFKQHGRHAQKHGSRGRDHGRGGGGERDGDNKRHRKGDMGRGEYFASNPDKRAKTQSAGKRKDEGGENQYGQTFSKDEIAAEERRPKRKVAVFIGYSGTGYKGMQISTSERTIEGDLFAAFVKAGAISKANADDPKKAGLVRCARTDKGVHAAGNMISLKLIVEDADIVEKINEALDPQIRVWGIERTIGSFSCYQAVDSRWYEYLIPSYSFLPPHPSSWLAKQLDLLADEAGNREAYDARQEEVKGYWEGIDDTIIKQVLDEIDEDIRWEVVKALQGEEEASAKVVEADVEGDEGKGDDEDPNVERKVSKGKTASVAEVKQPGVEDMEGIPAAMVDSVISLTPVTNEPANASIAVSDAAATAPAPIPEPEATPDATITTVTDAEPEAISAQPALTQTPEQSRLLRLRLATRKLRAAYNTAKRQYRIPARRIERIQQGLNHFLGTKNYHNYTVQKPFRDPSAKRNIKSFLVNKTPILIGDSADDADKSEWLSLKVHGQSFMMHQIRKMIGMVVLLIRCGADIDKTMSHSFTDAKYSIPKLPGLGLMLERPVFDTYNKLHAAKHEREPLLFSKYEDKIEAFKRTDIYGKMFAEEEQKGEFGRFFQHVDNFKEPIFLWLSSKGLEATKGRGRAEGYGEVKAIQAGLKP